MEKEVKQSKVIVSTSIPKSIEAAIDAEAKRQDRSKSYIVEKIILGEMPLPQAEPSIAPVDAVESEVSG